MNAADTATEAARAAQEAQRRAVRIARETRHAGSPVVAQAIRADWEPIKLFQQEMRRHGRYERAEPEGVVVND